MKNSIFLFILLCGLLSSCGQADRFKIRGIVPHEADKTVVQLYSYINDKITLVDSVYIRNKTFVFEGKEYMLSTHDGEKMNISDFVGKSKFLYIDFWASWCGPCIRDMPQLKEVYEKYKDQGLQIISISLDANENSWKTAIAKIDIPWTHLSDLKGENSEIKTLYKVDGIPHGILIDEKGSILITKANATALDIQMNDLLNN